MERKFEDSKINHLSSEDIIDSLTHIRELIKSKDAAEASRKDAIRQLGELGDIRATETLLEALQDAALLPLAIVSLAKVDPSSVPHFIEFATDKRPEVRRAVAKALGIIGNKNDAKELRNMLGDSNPEVCIKVILSLGEMQDTDAIPLLAHFCTEDPNPSIRRASIESLKKISFATVESPEFTKAIANVLETVIKKEKVKHIRDSAVQAAYNLIAIVKMQKTSISDEQVQPEVNKITEVYEKMASEMSDATHEIKKLEKNIEEKEDIIKRLEGFTKAICKRSENEIEKAVKEEVQSRLTEQLPIDTFGGKPARVRASKRKVITGIAIGFFSILLAVEGMLLYMNVSAKRKKEQEVRHLETEKKILEKRSARLDSEKRSLEEQFAQIKAVLTKIENEREKEEQIAIKKKTARIKSDIAKQEKRMRELMKEINNIRSTFGENVLFETYPGREAIKLFDKSTNAFWKSKPEILGIEGAYKKREGYLNAAKKAWEQKISEGEKIYKETEAMKIVQK